MKWEYKSELMPIDLNCKDSVEILNREGKNGWELVNVIVTELSPVAIFKRPDRVV